MPKKRGALNVYLYGEKDSGTKNKRKGEAVEEAEDFQGQDYDKIKEEYSKDKLFEDDEFDLEFPKMSVEWKRPFEICDNPKYFVNEPKPGDINQGALGDCWAIACMSEIPNFPKLFERIVPSDNKLSGEEYCGACRFRFQEQNKWIEVVIDDRLPTQNGQLVGVRSVSENEFWIPLLEKAYTKWVPSK